MPLKIKDTDEYPSSDASEPQPILHKPVEDRPLLRKILWSVFTLFVMASLIFLVYIFSIKNNTHVASDKFTIDSPTESPKHEAQQQIDSTASSGGDPSQRYQTKILRREYTVYISSYVNKEPAQEEVDRWNEAGYKASVVAANNHFRVSLGRFSAIPAAEQTAYELEEAFEYGYWIGSLN